MCFGLEALSKQTWNDADFLLDLLGQVHRGLSMATGEHQSRFEITSTEIRDVVLVQVKIKPAWMVPNIQSPRTVQAVESEIRLQVRDTDSSLRRSIPSLFRMVEAGNDQDSMHDYEADSSSTASVGAGESDASEEEQEPPYIVSDPEPLISFSRLSDDEDDAVQMQVSAPSVPARATRSPAQPAPAGASKSLRSENVVRLEGAELYSMARQSLACHDQKDKSKQSDFMFSHHMRCLGTKHYALKNMRKVIAAWHQLRQDGIGKLLCGCMW